MDCGASYRFSRESSKQRIALFEELASGPGAVSGRQLDLLAMEALNAMNQHRSVDLRQDVGSDLDDVIRGDAQNVRVERAMMERAQGNAVRHDRLSPRMAIGQTVNVNRSGASPTT